MKLLAITLLALAALAAAQDPTLKQDGVVDLSEWQGLWWRAVGHGGIEGSAPGHSQRRQARDRGHSSSLCSA